MFCASLGKSTQMLVVFIFIEWQNFRLRLGTLYMIILNNFISKKNISDLKTNLHADINRIKKLRLGKIQIFLDVSSKLDLKKTVIAVIQIGTAPGQKRRN